jgi:hypothetical protein
MGYLPLMATRYRLDPADEYNHDAGDVTNFNESMYFNAFDRQGRTGSWFRMGNRVNEGYAELSVCVYLPDGRVGFNFKRPKISSNERFAAGGMTIEIVEPLKTQRVTYEGKICLLERPYEMANPKRAFTENPMVDCVVDITFTGVSPIHGGRPVDADGNDVDTGSDFAKAHYEQLSSATGTITVDGTEYAIDGFGVRDKSWGPRFWQSLYWYRWLPMNFGADFGMTPSLIGAPNGRTHQSGWVFDGGEVHEITSVSVESTYDAERYQTSLRAKVITDAKTYDIEGTVRSLIPLRNRRATPEGDDLMTRITEGMTEYRCGDRVGFGLSEYLDQIIDGEPVGYPVDAVDPAGTD